MGDVRLLAHFYMLSGSFTCGQMEKIPPTNLNGFSVDSYVFVLTGYMSEV